VGTRTYSILGGLWLSVHGTRVTTQLGSLNCYLCCH